ncbi:M20/M25/M40 family metallo-hydrolase [Thermomonas alba]|uniref:M20/M25/M40 family metallo-hydrolase n=1 Tax=Thermomonas alba TaxID=2888525 RepID=UPI001F04619B|nr:M20/M25/M40 family metallo-hydrolase [Thermomonas alba]
MKRWILACALLAAGWASAQGVSAPERVDLDMTARIRQEAFQRSQVMDLLDHLTDVIGPRLTNSPAMAAANRWTRAKFQQWGLANVHDEAVEDLGRGWQFSRADVEMLSPRAMPLHALPKAWTPGTPGAIEGEAMYARLESKADLEQWKGKLRGKIVFLDPLRPYKPNEKPDFQRYGAADLDELLTFPLPKPRALDGEALARMRARMELMPLLNQYLADEGVLATVSISSWNDGIVRVMGGGSRKAGEPVGVPALVMMAEHYNTVMRALERKEQVRLRLDVDSRFLDETNQPGYNTIAEIPGVGPHKDEVVMLGAHMDSWHAGAGANDNAAGVAVMMEAMRILKAVGARPDRTIRVALWTGEEQGLLGSQAYVARHFAKFEEPSDPAQKALPAFMRSQRGKLVRMPEYAKISAYFNLDNGSGRIRGIYAQENLAAAPIFAEWLKPWHDVGATIVTQRNTGSTDHVSFDAVGIPGFQFVQDQLDYFSHVHHTDLDVQDHAVADDLKQASAIVAAFVYNAATRPQPLPRKPLQE